MVTPIPVSGPWATASPHVLGKARAIQLVVTDCDGALTDGAVYYSERGEELKRFSLRDGMGVARLRAIGVETAIVTQEVTPFARRRASKLGISEVHEGAFEKESVVRAVAARLGLRLQEVAYLGDDVNDLGALAAVGLSAAPSDGLHAVRRAVDWVTPSAGGHGAFRELAELVVWAHAALTEPGSRSFAFAQGGME